MPRFGNPSRRKAALTDNPGEAKNLRPAQAVAAISGAGDSLPTLMCSLASATASRPSCHFTAISLASRCQFTSGLA